MTDTLTHEIASDYINLLVSKLTEPSVPKHQWTEEQIVELYYYAYSFYQNGKYQEAVDFFRTLTNIDSRDYHYWMGLAGSLKMLQLYEKALECYTVAAIINENDPYLHAHAADCCFAKGDIDRGMTALDSAESLAEGKEHYKDLNSQLAVIRQAWSNSDRESSTMICNKGDKISCV